MRKTLFFLILSLGFLNAEPRIHEKVLICGVCRDVASRLTEMTKIVEQIGSLFEDYRVLIYENDSKDRTLRVLSYWSIKNPRVTVKSEKLDNQFLDSIAINQKNGTIFRPELIARARNKVLDMALAEEYASFPYLIWLDMDFVIPPTYEGIVEVFQSTQEWDAVFAYGLDPPGTYWDWYAFRDATYPIGPELMGDYWWRLNKKLALSRYGEWHPVYSAFGGCGIYRKSSIIDCRYSAIVTQDLEVFDRQLIEKGSQTGHPHILKYLSDENELNPIIHIDQPQPNLPKIEDSNIGIALNDQIDCLIWRMNFYTYQYPSLCEHVPFHASMILRGHDKLFINPRLVFTYGG
jgi:hypothetical protein